MVVAVEYFIRDDNVYLLDTKGAAGVKLLAQVRLNRKLLLTTQSEVMEWV